MQGITLIVVSFNNTILIKIPERYIVGSFICASADRQLMACYKGITQYLIVPVCSVAIA